MCACVTVSAKSTSFKRANSLCCHICCKQLMLSYMLQTAYAVTQSANSLRCHTVCRQLTLSHSLQTAYAVIQSADSLRCHTCKQLTPLLFSLLLLLLLKIRCLPYLCSFLSFLPQFASRRHLLLALLLGLLLLVTPAGHLRVTAQRGHTIVELSMSESRAAWLLGLLLGMLLPLDTYAQPKAQVGHPINAFTRRRARKSINELLLINIQYVLSI